MQQDYYSTLANVVRISACDDPEKRRAIYALARSELRRQLEKQHVNASVRTQELRALEMAIEKIESDLARPSPSAKDSVGKALAAIPSSVEILPPEQHLPRFSQLQYQPSVAPATRPRRWLVPSALLLIGAAILVTVTYLVVERGLHDDAVSVISAASTMADNGQRLLRPTPAIEIPIPTAYGVYALSDGHLRELTALPIKAAERRVRISGVIAFQSETKLPNGRIQFVVFRADIVNNAPEKVAVRAVTKIAHASDSIDDGANEADAWSIRETAYQMKVAPIDGNPAMVLIRPAVANFSFPAGRYVLVLKSVAYDFSVEGPVTDLAQCVEPTSDEPSSNSTQCHK